jgi:hypothetical protein
MTRARSNETRIPPSLALFPRTREPAVCEPAAAGLWRGWRPHRPRARNQGLSPRPKFFDLAGVDTFSAHDDHVARLVNYGHNPATVKADGPRPCPPQVASR